MVSTSTKTYRCIVYLFSSWIRDILILLMDLILEVSSIALETKLLRMYYILSVRMTING